MYQPTHFKQDNLAALYQLIQQYPLATLIVVVDGAVEVNHIPVEWVADASNLGLLKGHIAKANPLADLLVQEREAYLVFHAEQQYISPNGYASKAIDHRAVPTWNYRVVHVKGQIKRVDDEIFLRGLLARLTRQHEASQTTPWTMSQAPEDYIRSELKEIVGIEIQITAITGKFKLSQNQSEANAQSAAQHLNLTDPTMADLIREHHPSAIQNPKKTPE